MMFYYKMVPKTALSYDRVCPVCQKTLSQVRAEGLFGCSACYDTFLPYLDLTPFVGKGYEEKTVDSVEELKEKLKAALAEENYEQAALYRDRIREKEGK